MTKTGGGARPATPNDGVIEIKDLLNPAEVFRDHNIYDSDGINHDDYINNMISHSKMLKEEEQRDVWKWLKRNMQLKWENMQLKWKYINNN
ncbi:unnamed protein product [Parnassius mnemosyne]|uniref:Uncharacterized protein n=1 Tax=Parnassius mnemosyne TaxID=213953 RepID=A0AAV1KGH1_9NEOP